MKYILLISLLFLHSDQYRWSGWDRQIEKPRIRMVVGRDFTTYYSKNRMVYYEKGKRAVEVNYEGARINNKT